MDGYDDSTYGATWAPLYDSLYPGPGPEQIDFLIGRAQGGPVLELAVGSGRVALPLIEAGVEVHGVEISDEMIEKLRDKPGGETLPIVASDMTSFTVDERYPLVLLGFNTLFGPLDSAAQQGIFASVAKALTADGCFVVEGFVPDLDRFDRGQSVRVREVTADRFIVEYTTHDAASQISRTMVEIRWRDGRSAVLPVWVRYLWPEQIDAMASAAGLELSERYEWYDESPFTEDSSRHVSVYRLAPTVS